MCITCCHIFQLLNEHIDGVEKELRKTITKRAKRIVVNPAAERKWKSFAFGEAYIWLTLVYSELLDELALGHVVLADKFKVKLSHQDRSIFVSAVTLDAFLGARSNCQLTHVTRNGDVGGEAFRCELGLDAPTVMIVSSKASSIQLISTNALFARSLSRATMACTSGISALLISTKVGCLLCSKIALLKPRIVYQCEATRYFLDYSCSRYRHLLLINQVTF